MSGNAAEIVEASDFPPAPAQTLLLGGSYRDPPVAISEQAQIPASAIRADIGFRIVRQRVNFP